MLKENDIQKSVLEKIKAGDVSMRPRFYFILRTVLIGSIDMLAVACALFVLSFVFFSIHESDVGFLLEFGEKGLLTFITLLPWILLLLAFAFLIGIELLVRRTTSAYRFSLLRIFLWVLVFLTVASVCIEITPLHSFLLSRADRDQLPILGPLYEQIHDSHQKQGVYQGEITSITDSEFVISHNDNDSDSDEGSWTIVPPTGFDLRTLSIGEKVYLGGYVRDGMVYSYGIHLLPNER